MMPTTLRKEFQDVVDELKGRVHEGESLKERSGHVVREVMDVVGHVRRAFDDANFAVDLEAFRLEVEEFVSQVVAIVLVDRPWVCNIVQGAKGMIAGGLVTAGAEKGHEAIAFIDNHVVPELRWAEDILHHVIVQLSGQ